MKVKTFYSKLYFSESVLAIDFERGFFSIIFC